MRHRQLLWAATAAIVSLAAFGCNSAPEEGGADVSGKKAEKPVGPPSVATPGKEPPNGPPGAMANGGGGPPAPGGARGGPPAGGGGQGGGGRGGVGFLLANDQVKKELAITEDQAKKLQAILPQPGQGGPGGPGGGTQVSPEERQKQAEELQKKVDGVLNATQKTRLQEIRYQVMGARAFSNPDVVKALAITADQTKKLEALNPPRGQGGPGGSGGAAPGGGGPGAGGSNVAPGGGGPSAGPAAGGGGQMTPEERQKRREERMKKALEVLTDAQRAKWTKLTGKPFVLQMQPRGGGGGASRGAAAAAP